jgi:hypothetical protein
MGRVSERHLRYRTKDEIVQDVTFVLNAPLKNGTKWAVLRDIAWVWTEFQGKYKGCRHWTKMARLKQSDAKARLRHEHVVPRTIVINMLLELNSPSREQVHEICERYLIGAVVTPDEDARLNEKYGRTMPKDFYEPTSPQYRDPWLRYKECNIEIDGGYI